MHAAGQQDQTLVERNQAHLVGKVGARQISLHIVEFHGVHKAGAADVDDLGRLLANGCKALLQAAAKLLGPLAKLLLCDHV
ncbi:hypothetical protein D3C87_2036020 [compost metagenome]